MRRSGLVSARELRAAEVGVGSVTVQLGGTGTAFLLDGPLRAAAQRLLRTGLYSLLASKFSLMVKSP